MTLSLPIEHEANELLSRDGFALLLAMMLDQQVPFEKAFNSPYQLTLRLGHEPSAQEIAEFDPDALAEVFAERPALHRFPRAMAARAQELARIVTNRYGGDASTVWATAKDAAELKRRLAELPGFGANSRRSPAAPSRRPLMRCARLARRYARAGRRTASGRSPRS
jgi:uncharacterized HhH-GPD family protein